MSAFFDRLREVSRERDSLLCVGLDPDPERIPGGAAGALEHCRRVVGATAGLAACFKPNAAFWEQYGPAGIDALHRLREEIAASRTPFLLDAKRADIGSTMAAYARAAFEILGADAATVHAYHGADSLFEFAKFEDRGVYVVCRTSNPGAADLQHLDAGGAPFYRRVAELAARVNRGGNLALVVGATAPAEVADVRSFSPLPFLLPGVGAQGGDLEAAVRAAWNGDPASALVATSRAVLYADDPARAAAGFRDRINQVVAAARG